MHAHLERLIAAMRSALAGHEGMRTGISALAHRRGDPRSSSWRGRGRRPARQRHAAAGCRAQAGGRQGHRVVAAVPRLPPPIGALARRPVTGTHSPEQERSTWMSGAALLSTDDLDLSIDVNKAKNAFADHLDSLSIVTSYSHGDDQPGHQSGHLAAGELVHDPEREPGRRQAARPDLVDRHRARARREGPADDPRLQQHLPHRCRRDPEDPQRQDQADGGRAEGGARSHRGDPRFGERPEVASWLHQEQAGHAGDRLPG